MQQPAVQRRLQLRAQGNTAVGVHLADRDAEPVGGAAPPRRRVQPGAPPRPVLPAAQLALLRPHPGTHDYYVIYRTMDHAREPSRWRGLDLIAGRSPQQLAWYPARRREKAVFDIAVELLPVLDRGFPAITRTPAYRLLEAHLTCRIRAEDPAGEVAGYQIALVKASGYDTSEKPSLIMASPYTPLTPPAHRCGAIGTG
jgi:hypothetical protein